MNILYIHTHDTGRYLQPYGYNAPTPHLLSLAKEGVLFRNCFCAAPTCSPSRAALLTGVNPHSSGMLGLVHRGFTLRDPAKHLANHLKQHGYETVLCGIQHVIAGNRVSELGYDRVLQGDVSGRAHGNTDPDRNMTWDRANAKAVGEYLQHVHKNTPFFLSFGMFSTHRPFPRPDSDPDYVQPAPTLPDNAATREDMAGFLTSVRCVDDCVGIVLNGLEESGLADKTLVLFTTDHGISFPGMKCHLYDAGIGVALLMKIPGTSYRGRTVDALVSHLDIYPTLCDLAGIERPEWLEGSSIMPLLTGEQANIRDEIFAEVTYHAAYEPMRCIRTTRYKYIRYDDDFELVVKPNIDDGASKQFLLEHGLHARKHDDAEMLFDLYFDPCEKRNLIHDPEYAAIRTELSSRLRQWMQKTADPLLTGNVQKPRTTKVDVKSGVSVSEYNYEEEDQSGKGGVL